MATTMFFYALISSLMITTLYCSMFDGMIFGGLRKLFYNLPAILHQPVYDCLTCMGGIYGAATYFFFYNFDLKLFFIHVLVVIGINALIEKYINE